MLAAFVVLGATFAAHQMAVPGRILLLVAASALLAWCMLGGLMSARRLIEGMRLRRDLGQLRPLLATHRAAALAIGPDGMVLAQNGPALTRMGEQVGRCIQDGLGRNHADPMMRWREIAIAVSRFGRCDVDLGIVGRFLVTRSKGASVQLWQAEELPRRKTAPPPEALLVDEFDLLPVPLLKLDGGAMILRANEPARDMLGDAAPGQSLGLLLDGLGREIGDWVADVAAGRTTGGSEVLHIKGDGPQKFIQVTLTRGSGDQVTAVLSDASALKTLEAQFVQSQKMQAIGQLAGGIAHDFNNLLTAITGHCDLLMLRHDKADPDYADLDQISQNANRAAALVRQLLAFSRKQTLKPRMMDLRDTLSDLTHLLNRLVGERIVLTFDHDPSLRMIRADRRQLEQVIMNLVVNARDAMPNGGDITVTTDNFKLDDCTEINRATLPSGDYVRVQVRDQGCGISNDDLTKIFEPFYTTKRTGEGTGLGLSTAYGIVKQTGGYIFCDSALGLGSTFSLFFPAHDKTIEPEPEEQAARPSLSRRESDATVLLVEDETAVRAFASRALKLQGFNVLEAACAEDALALLADPGLKVDVFVTDVVMPGMDGPTWVKTALGDRPGTKVIFMSGYAEDVFNEGRDPVPNSAFLAKPFSLSELTALVGRELESSVS